MSLKCNTCLIESSSEVLQEPAFVLHIPFYDKDKMLPVQGDTLLVFQYCGPHLAPYRRFVSVTGALESFKESGIRFWAHMPKELYPLTDQPDFYVIKERTKAEEKQKQVQWAKDNNVEPFDMKEWYRRTGSGK